jgi:hypothetical protein
MILARIEDVLPALLEDIDAVLAEAETPIPERALRAAIVIAEECMLEVRGASRDNPISQPWLVPILQFANEWYRGKYGPVLGGTSSNYVSVFVVARGAPLLVRVPLGITGPSNVPEHVTLSYPADLAEDEDPIAMTALGSASDWPASDTAALANRVGSLVSRVRRLAHDLRTADPRPMGPPGADGVLDSISRAAQAVAANTDTSRRHAVWDLNFAAELVLKAFIAQRGVEPQRIHNIVDLHEAAVGLGLSPLSSGAARRLPAPSIAIDARYDTGPVPSLRDLEEQLADSLDISAHVARQLTRGIRILGASFTIRRLSHWRAES